MKKVVILFLILASCLSLCACAGGSRKDILTTENITVDGVFVNDSYQDSNESSRRAMYVFLTVDAKETNYKEKQLSKYFLKL